MAVPQPGGLLERSEELARLREAIDAARTGRGGAIVLEGPAGIGKTSLLHAGRDLAAQAGLRVLVARAGQLEHELGWNLVRQVFAGVIAAPDQEQARVLRGAAALAAAPLGLTRGAEAGGLHGLYWLISGLAEEGPLAVFVDDAHWGDLSSLLFLSYLVERVRDLPIVVVITVRHGEERPEPLTVLSSRPAAQVLRLRELSAAASDAMTREVLGAGTAEAFSSACHQSSGGNPFLLRELLDQLRRDGVPPTAERAAEVSGVTPDTVARAVLVRLARLPAEAQALAGIVAVLAEGSLAEAAALAGGTDERAAASADQLAETGILRPGFPLAFVHPVVREVIYAELPQAQRERLHAAAARLLGDHGELSRAAAQLLETEPRGDARVVQLLTGAAATADRDGAPAVAVSLLRRALREPPGSAQEPDILVALGRSEAAAGEAGAAARLAAALTVCREPRRRAEIALERGRLLYLAGQIADSAQAFDSGLAELAADGEPDASLTSELRAGWLTAARLDVPLRARAAQLTYELAEHPPAGDNYGERALLAHIAGQLTFDAAPRAQALELTRRALGDGALLRDETSDGMAWIAAMGALGWGDYFDEYEALLEAALEDSRRRGSVLGFATAAYGLSFSRVYRGMLSDAVADAEQAIAAERDGWRHFLTAARAQLAWALVERGEYDAADAQLRLAEGDPALGQTSAHALVLEARARLQLVRGEHAAALATALESGRIATDAGIPNPSIFA
ncbi:MAG TPA: AAA family ATPase, partial [Solirubrobacteraceae bacterium]|nr:AAA family ATPase [Solirubrobacteraceae bacterium]